MNTQTITRNLGGDRLGSGAKNNITLHNYNRSTHDLSKAWRSSMTVGTLVPFMKVVGIPGDTFSIDLESLVKTIPTIGPLYGSFKLQLDVFECPIRLYNGLLHNNMTKIGLSMDEVKFPLLELKTKMYNPYKYYGFKEQIAKDSLLNYLGIKGIADYDWNGSNATSVIIERDFNAIPILAYWDIYKNYYANKQEEKGVVITPKIVDEYGQYNKLADFRGSATYSENVRYFDTPQDASAAPLTITCDTFQKLGGEEVAITQIGNHPTVDYYGYFECQDNYGTDLYIILKNGTSYIEDAFTNIWGNIKYENNRVYVGNQLNHSHYTSAWKVYGIAYNKELTGNSEIEVQEFPLSNIDDARTSILQATGLGNILYINGLGEPYSSAFRQDTADITAAKNNLAGIGIKTYQSDLLNNWLKTEWIDGTNGINQITAVDVSSGSFTIDALNLANKVYNMLNRIAVSGGSYEDYIEAVYTVKANRRAENPIYRGGMSAEIIFDEVVSTATSEEQPLGTLAGRGNMYAKQGGHIEIGMLDEPAYIMGIVSITPRIDYSQGNDWDMSELMTMADLHKPQLDGIGFEDLLQERAAWWGTVQNGDGTFKKLAMGKSPAWINYMTALNESHGDFADENKTMYMTLNRRYETPIVDSAQDYKVGIRDLTTYIDPRKYNYAFADVSLTAQNFWVQIGIKIEARRVMSAKIIPNL